MVKSPAKRELESGGFGGISWEVRMLEGQNVRMTLLAASHCVPCIIAC